MRNRRIKDSKLSTRLGNFCNDVLFVNRCSLQLFSVALTVYIADDVVQWV